MRGRIGLATPQTPSNAAGADAAADAHIATLLAWMQSHRADWTNTLRGVYALSVDRCTSADWSEATEEDVMSLVVASGANPGGEGGLRSWLTSHFAVLVGSCDSQPRREGNGETGGGGEGGGPVYVPRNHLLHRAIEASTGGDRSVLRELFDIMVRPNTPSKDPYVHARFSESSPEVSDDRHALLSKEPLLLENSTCSWTHSRA